MAGVTVSRAIVKWFAGKEMALAMGVEMAVARLGVFAVLQTSPRINKAVMDRLGDVTGVAAIESLQAPILFVFILLCIGLLLYLVYGVFDKKLETQMRGIATETGADEEGLSASRI